MFICLGIRRGLLFVFLRAISHADHHNHHDEAADATADASCQVGTMIRRHLIRGRLIIILIPPSPTFPLYRSYDTWRRLWSSLKGKRRGRREETFMLRRGSSPEIWPGWLPFARLPPCFPWVIDASQSPSTKNNNIAEHVAMGDRGKWSSRQEKRKSWP